jgi:D-3-phosphoglycerate dehydrogenase
VTLVLALSHRLRERDRALHDGDWGEGRFAPTGSGLAGRTLGVIGYGRIGREVGRLLEPWGMRVAVTQRTPVDEPGVTYLPLDTLLAEADVVVVACPLTDETRGMLDARRLALMKPTAFLVNVARGAIVDQAALVSALRDGRLAGAGLDVVDPEPLPADDPLLELPNVVGAPHSLGYTDDLVRGCVEQVCAALLAVATGRVPDDVVNPDVLDNPLFTAKLERFAARGGASR